MTIWASQVDLKLILIGVYPGVAVYSNMNPQMR